MTTATSARWVPPVKTTLPNLYGLYTDLFRVHGYVSWLERYYEKNPHDFTANEAIVTAAVARYARPFGKGQGKLIDLTDIASLTEADKKFHQRVIDIRNKHIAHPVNAFEVNEVYVWYHEGNPEPKVTSVSAGAAQTVGLSGSEMVMLKKLCEKLLEYVNKLLNEECDKLMQLAKSLTPHQILALPKGPSDLSVDPQKPRKKQA